MISWISLFYCTQWCNLFITYEIFMQYFNIWLALSLTYIQAIMFPSFCINDDWQMFCQINALYIVTIIVIVCICDAIFKAKKCVFLNILSICNTSKHYYYLVTQLSQLSIIICVNLWRESCLQRHSQIH